MRVRFLMGSLFSGPGMSFSGNDCTRQRRKSVLERHETLKVN